MVEVELAAEAYNFPMLLVEIDILVITFELRNGIFLFHPLAF